MKASCSTTLDDKPSRIPVTLMPYGDLFRLHLVESNRYAGLIESATLNKITSRFSVRLMVMIRNCKEKIKKSHSSKPTDVDVEVVIYGFRRDADSIGNLLSEDEIYLQHPTEHDHRFVYFNPQYLLRPGSEMPRVQDMDHIMSSNSSSEDDILDEKRTIQTLQVFNYANGPVVFSRASESRRLITPLQEQV